MTGDCLSRPTILTSPSPSRAHHASSTPVTIPLTLLLRTSQVGDVCQAGATADVCVPGTLATNMWGNMRSGRPTEFDEHVFGLNVGPSPRLYTPHCATPSENRAMLCRFRTTRVIMQRKLCNPPRKCADSELISPSKVTCIPAFNPADNATFTVDANGTSVPLRPASYCRKTAAAEAVPTQHYTIVFTCFVLLQWFNQINARKIHGEVSRWIPPLVEGLGFRVWGQEDPWGGKSMDSPSSLGFRV